MKKQEEKLYTFEEFDKHISLYNIIPQGNGNALVLLRKIYDGIESEWFERNPSILISGEGAMAHGLALANTICSLDVRYYQAKYLYMMNDLIDCFKGSSSDTIHIISGPEDIAGSESALWSMLNKREYKFTGYDRKQYEFIHVHGLIILVTNNLAAVSPLIRKSIDFEIITDRCSQVQLELVVCQRLNFCSVDYQDSEEVLKAIVSQGAGRIEQVMEFLKICILIAKTEDKPVDMRIVNRVIRLTSVGAPPIFHNDDGIPF